MSDTIEYTARTMGLYDLDGELYISVATACGQHVKISAGFAQALMMNEATAAYIAKHFRKQETDAATIQALTA